MSTSLLLALVLFVLCFIAFAFVHLAAKSACKRFGYSAISKCFVSIFSLIFFTTIRIPTIDARLMLIVFLLLICFVLFRRVFLLFFVGICVIIVRVVLGSIVSFGLS